MEFRALYGAFCTNLLVEVYGLLGGSPTISGATSPPQLPCIIPQISAMVDQTGCIIQGTWGVLEVLSGVEEEAGDTSRTPRIPLK